ARYDARRNQGSARRLVARNGVLHIFVRGRNSDPWDPEEVNKTLERIAEADQWLSARAAESNVQPPPMFIHRYLTLADEPFWHRVDVPEASASLEYKKAWFEAILTRFFNVSSFADLFDRTFAGMDMENRAVAFHTANRDLTLFVPYRRQPTDMESMFVACT